MNWSELNLTDNTCKLLDELRDRKEKWDRLQAALPVYVIMTAGMGLFFVLFFYRYVMAGSAGNVMAILDMFISNPYVLYSLLGCISFLMFTRNLMNRIEKAKNKYEQLRVETIDKLDGSWLKSVESETIDQISIFLKKEYDINVVYKS